MVDAKGAILLFMLLTQTAHLASAQCNPEHGSGECSEGSSSFSAASTDESSATSKAQASAGPNGQSSAYSYASVTGSSDDIYTTSSSSSSSSSGSSSSSSYAHASSSESATTESSTVTQEVVVVEVPDEPAEPAHEPPPEEPSIVYYPCDYNEPVALGKRVYFVTTDGEPCPEPTVTAATPEEPKLPAQPAPPAPPAPPEDEHHVTARRVRALVDMRNFTALSDFVIDSDDVYGMNMGLRFKDHEQEEEIRKTDNREEDKDVVTVKGLASAALDYETKLKVIQLMVVTATAPDGYQLNQHRGLVESFLEIFSDDELLATVIASDPGTYSRRRLQCVGCTPVNSYICANCWPKSICKAYFWCSADAKGDKSEEETTEEKPIDTAKVLSEDSESLEDYPVAEVAESSEESGSQEEPDVDEQSKKKKKRRRRRRRRLRKKARRNKSEDRDPTP